jgi:putative transposase
MWTDEQRQKYDRRGGRRYPSDLKDKEWEGLEPHLPLEGRPRDYDFREVVNGVRYVLFYGIPWDATPKDLPPWWVLYAWYRFLADGDHLRQTNHLLLIKSREMVGREASPTAVILDSRSVKCVAPAGARGYDGAKQTSGRKQHMATDTGGRLIDVLVTTADVQDQDAGLVLAQRVVRLCPWVETFIVDGGYKETFRRGVEEVLKRKVEVVKRPAAAKGFVLLPKRWKVEQTFGVAAIRRRLRVDYESLLPCSTAMFLLASVFRLATTVACS